MGGCLNFSLIKGEHLRTKVGLEDSNNEMIPAGAILVVDDVEVWLDPDDNFYLEVEGYILDSKPPRFVSGAALIDEVFERTRGFEGCGNKADES